MSTAAAAVVEGREWWAASQARGRGRRAVCLACPCACYDGGNDRRKEGSVNVLKHDAAGRGLGSAQAAE